MRRLDEAVVSGQAGHLDAHAALKADYLRRGEGTFLPDYTSTTTAAEHAAIHSVLHADHVALGNGPLPPSPTAGHLDHHAALHAAYNQRLDVLTSYTVTPTGDYYAAVQRYLDALASRSDKSTLWTLKFAPGTYDLPDQWTVRGLENVHITSEDPTRPATLNKGSNWSGEYLLRLYHGSDIRISHLNLIGNHNYDAADDAVHWSDQGVWFASCHDTRVDHCRFSDIGNAAIRHNTALDDAEGVHSWNHVIEDNSFTNCWQVTTTQDSGTRHGASFNWTVQRNTFNALRGSVKFASRTAGAHTARITSNTWTETTGTPIELCSVNDVEIRGNTFTKTAGAVINAYTNDLDGLLGFSWARSIVITDNASFGSGDGVRLALTSYSDGYRPQGSDLVFSRNTIAGVSNRDPGRAALRIAYGGITGVTFTENHFSGIANRSPRSFSSQCSGITAEGNTLDGAPFR